jgi:chromate transporter
MTREELPDARFDVPVTLAPSTDVAQPAERRMSRPALFARFLRFGFMAWGGPVAQIAMLRRELVDEERWIDSARFNRLLAVYQVLPGPEAHELAVHLGYLRGGRIGGLLAGLGFMLPGFVLMFLLSWLYFQVDLAHAAIGAAFLGVQIAVIALIVRAVQRIGQHILTDQGLWLLAIAAGLGTLAGIPFWVTLPLAGLAHAIAGRTGFRSPYLVALVAAGLALAWSLGPVDGVVPGPTPLPGAPTTVAGSASVFEVFLTGLKAGLLTFGGAYTAIPFVRGDAVGSGWLTDAQFLDGLALSGILPAPLIIFSTFVGYVAGGAAGALAMTAGIFLPAFSFTLLLGERIESVIEHPGLQHLLEGVAAGVVGLIAVTTLQLAVVVAGRLPPSAAGAGVGVLIFAAALAVLVLWKSKAAVPLAIAGGALAGWLAFGALLPVRP